MKYDIVEIKVFICSEKNEKMILFWTKKSNYSFMCKKFMFQLAIANLQNIFSKIDQTR